MLTTMVCIHQLRVRALPISLLFAFFSFQRFFSPVCDQVTTRIFCSLQFYVTFLFVNAWGFLPSFLFYSILGTGLK